MAAKNSKRKSGAQAWLTDKTKTFADAIDETASSETQGHRQPTQSVCVADRNFIVNVLDLPFALPIPIYR